MPLLDSANIDLTEVDHAFSDVELRGKRAAPAFRQLRKPMRGDQREHAKAQSGPDASWAARSAMTEARRGARARAQRNRKRALHPSSRTSSRSMPKRILGRLPSAILVLAGDLFVRAVSRVEWSGVHQYGGTAGRGAQIPRRTFLWLSDKLIATCEQVILDHVLDGWSR